MREEINLTKVLEVFFGGGGVLNAVRHPRTLLVFDIPFGTSETSRCFRLVHPSKTDPPPRAPLRQIQSAVMLMSSEGKLSH
jgi:hypothetical protein